MIDQMKSSSFLIFVSVDQAVIEGGSPTQAHLNTQDTTATVAKSGTFTKPFIYLTQTEQCLPPNLASSSQIGDADTCNCDVIVLSFRTECLERNSSHIFYLFDPNTGWGTGRNVLYFTAIKRTRVYNYYIFIDEDVVLMFNDFAPPAMKKLQPFRAFEEWLLDYEPAVGVLDYRAHHGANWTFDRRQKLCGITERSMVLPVVWYDGLFNAYHWQALKHLFPYHVQHEKESWWALHRYIFTAVELKFRGQALMFVPVTAGNPRQRSYPKSNANINKYWREYIETIQQDAPLVYKNFSIFKDFQENLNDYVINTLTYCMNVIRHKPIIPYAHLKSTLRLS